MRNEDLGLVAIVLLFDFLSRDRLEADLHHGSIGVTVPSCFPGCLRRSRLLYKGCAARVCSRERRYAAGRRLVDPLPLTAGLLLPTVFVFIYRKCVFFSSRAQLKGAVRKEPVQRMTLNVTLSL